MICIKIIRVLYSLVVRLRTNGIEIVLENLMPTEILIRFWQDFTVLNGFGGVKSIRDQFPTGIAYTVVMPRGTLQLQI